MFECSFAADESGVEDGEVGGAARGQPAPVCEMQAFGWLAGDLAARIGVPVPTVERAVKLCKLDLLTEVVAEFPELQGTMGRLYAKELQEDEAVANACEALGHLSEKIAEQTGKKNGLTAQQGAQLSAAAAQIAAVLAC